MRELNHKYLREREASDQIPAKDDGYKKYISISQVWVHYSVKGSQPQPPVELTDQAVRYAERIGFPENKSRRYP